MPRRLLTITALLLPAALAAQPPAAPTAAPPAPDSVVLAFARFADGFGSRLVAALTAIPADQYGYRPTPPQQTVGYIAQHLEDANYSLCEDFSPLKHARTRQDSVADTVKARWPKDTLLTRLAASLRFCDEAMEHAGPLRSPALAGELLAFETDLAEHYSQLATYMRLLGLVPPSAVPPRARTAVALPAAELARYVGTYRVAPGFELAVSQRDSALFIVASTGGRTVQLWPESRTDFFVREVDAQVSFMRDPSGAVTGLVLHQNGRDRPAPKVR